MSLTAGATPRPFQAPAAERDLEAEVIHCVGGVLTDFLRNLSSDQGLPAGVLEDGIPPCAVTTIEDLNVVSIATTAHLA